MDDLQLQFQRLKRNYEQSLKTYDPVSFLELANALRVWTEMSETVDNALGSKKFKRFSLSKNVKKLLRGSEYAYSYLHDGVTGSAEATGEKDARMLVSGPFEDRDFTVSSLVKLETTGEITISEYMLVYRTLPEYEIKILVREGKSKKHTDISYTDYLQAPAIHFQIGKHVPTHITNAELVKRVANEYGASHSVKNLNNEEFSNRFSEPVKELMRYQVSSLPLPYFVLLHIAQTIIEVLKETGRA